MGRNVAPQVGSESLTGLLTFIGVFALFWGALALAANVVSTVLFAMIVLRLYLDAGPAAEVSLPAGAGDEVAIDGRRLKVPWGMVIGGLVAAVVGMSDLAYFVMRSGWMERPVLVIAHRGASHDAPENTLAAFRRAVEEQAD